MRFTWDDVASAFCRAEYGIMDCASAINEPQVYHFAITLCVFASYPMFIKTCAWIFPVRAVPPNGLLLPLTILFYSWLLLNQLEAHTGAPVLDYPGAAVPNYGAIAKS